MTQSTNPPIPIRTRFAFWLGSLLAGGRQRLAAAVSIKIDDASAAGWQSLTHGRPHDRDDNDQLYLDALTAWRKNPMAWRIVATTTNYTIGKGITLTSANPNLQAFIDAFWHHPQNRIDNRLEEISNELARAGDIFPVLFRNKSDGMSYLRFLTKDQIQQIETAENDWESETAVVQKPTSIEGEAIPWPTPRHPEAAAADAIALHYHVNRPLGATFGESDLTTILPWLLRYSRMLDDRVRLNWAMRVFLWIVKVPSNKVQVKADQYKTTPEPGSVIVTDDSESWEPLSPQVRGADVAPDMQAVRQMIDAGSGYPPHWRGEATDVNRATAGAMEHPAEKQLSRRQTYFLFILQDIIYHAYQRAAQLQPTTYPPLKETNYRSLFTAHVADISKSDNLDLADAALRMARAYRDLARELPSKSKTLSAKFTQFILKFAGEPQDEDTINQIITEAFDIPDDHVGAQRDAPSAAPPTDPDSDPDHIVPTLTAQNARHRRGETAGQPDSPNAITSPPAASPSPFYAPVTDPDAEITMLDWSLIPDKTRHRWATLTAYYLREEITIPHLLRPLIPDAEAINRDRTQSNRRGETAGQPAHPPRPTAPPAVSPNPKPQQEPQTMPHTQIPFAAADDNGRFITINPMRFMAHEEATPDGRPRFKFILCSAGHIRNVRNEDSYLAMTANALRNAVNAGLFTNLAAFIDHAHYEPSSTRNLLGVWDEPTWNEELQSITAVLNCYVNNNTQPTIDQLQQMSADIDNGRPAPDVGISIVFYPDQRRYVADDDTLYIQSLQHVESADYVFFPAVRNARLIEQLNGRFTATFSTFGGTNPMPTEITQPIDDTQPAVGAQRAAPSPTAVLEEPAPPPANQRRILDAATTQVALSAWQEEIAGQAASIMILNSGLPQPTINRLTQTTYDSPADVRAAIAAARAELAELQQDDTVQLGGRHPRSGITGMTTDIERAQNDVEWFFGVEGAQAPAYNMRRFDQLYVALTGDVAFNGVFDPTRIALSAASPVTLPNLAVDAMNKVIMAQFSRLAFWRWFEQVATVAPNDGSLHDAKWIVYGGTGNLPVVADTAAYTPATIGDAKETAAFTKHGVYVPISRKMIKNSDIARIRAVPIALATDAVRTRSAAISSLFTTASGVGPDLADGNPLFHASGSNVATTALGTNTAAWETASTECFNHVEVGSGKAIATFAKYCLTPSQLYFQALKNFGYGDGNPTTYNPFAQSRSQDDPRPVVLAVPDWSDANDWAYVADPAIWPVIMMTYSQNPGGGTHPAPELFTVVSETAGLMFTNDMMPIKIRDEFAAGVNGRAGIGKRNVA